MTLEEAIVHAKDTAKSAIGCECREEHRQLAEWLNELAERRKQPEIIRCKDCKHRRGETDFICPFNMSGADDFFCKLGERSERRTDG